MANKNQAKQTAVADILSQYLNEIRKYPILTKEEERSLLEKYLKEDDIDARNRLVECNLRLVAGHVLQHYKTTEWMDLINECNLGLMDAIERFDLTSQYRLSTFAVVYIKKRASKFLQLDDIMPLSDRTYREVARLKRTENTFYTKNGRYPTREEMADLMGISTEAVDKLYLARNSSVVSLDRVLEFDSGDNNEELQKNMTLSPLLIDENNVEDIVCQNALQDSVHDMLNSIPPDEARIIAAEYGLDNGFEKSQEQIGNLIGISRYYVKQLSTKGKKKILHTSREQHLEELL